MGKGLALFILIITWLQALLGPFSIRSSIEVVSESAQVQCAGGEIVNIPKGSSLEYANVSDRFPLIVKVPTELIGSCSVGYLKMSQDVIDDEKLQKIALAVDDLFRDSISSEVAINEYFKEIFREDFEGNSTLIDSEVAAETSNKNKSLRSSKHKKHLYRGAKKVTAKEKAKLKKVKVLAKVAKRMKYADGCINKFVSQQGFGSWGKYVKRELSTGQFQSLMKNSKAFRNVCPGFQQMNREERKNLWVFILMSMSHYESSCRIQVENQGPYGIAKGLLQLHEGAEDRYAHWDLEGVCRRGDSKKPKDSLQCTLSMLNGQVKRFNSIFFEKSYWDVLRNVKSPGTHAAKIRTAIQKLPGCQLRSVASNGSHKKQI